VSGNLAKTKQAFVHARITKHKIIMSPPMLLQLDECESKVRHNTLCEKYYGNVGNSSQSSERITHSRMHACMHHASTRSWLLWGDQSCSSFAATPDINKTNERSRRVFSSFPYSTQCPMFDFFISLPYLCPMFVFRTYYNTFRMMSFSLRSPFASARP
jgi:hypothetical protein